MLGCRHEMHSSISFWASDSSRLARRLFMRHCDQTPLKLSHASCIPSIIPGKVDETYSANASMSCPPLLMSLSPPVSPFMPRVPTASTHSGVGSFLETPLQELATRPPPPRSCTEVVSGCGSPPKVPPPCVLAKPPSVHVDSSHYSNFSREVPKHCRSPSTLTLMAPGPAATWCNTLWR
ncbi:hypothetical protein Salat_2418600 [Sesamum alatum]|uniref:Uncharacterized protein n=1 Tax=Sesamum alatum TaxID=300844 RepID=A0AAE1XYP8_9LAMI|nr:hypothetical protein Salat_2418600 [Sesamum alatum]